MRKKRGGGKQERQRERGEVEWLDRKWEWEAVEAIMKVSNHWFRKQCLQGHC